MIARALHTCFARYDSIVLVFHAVFSHTTNETEKVDCTNNNAYKVTGWSSRSRKPSVAARGFVDTGWRSGEGDVGVGV